jgi:hypothetical protein
MGHGHILGRVDTGHGHLLGRENPAYGGLVPGIQPGGNRVFCRIRNGVSGGRSFDR